MLYAEVLPCSVRLSSFVWVVLLCELGNTLSYPWTTKPFELAVSSLQKTIFEPALTRVFNSCQNAGLSDPDLPLYFSLLELFSKHPELSKVTFQFRFQFNVGQTMPQCLQSICAILQLWQSQVEI